MATVTYCAGQITGTHVKGPNQFTKRRYGSRIEALQYRYREPAGGPMQGGVFVSDGLLGRRSELLFQFQE